MKMDKEDRKLIQRVLRKAGFYRGPIDGIIGPKTMKAAMITNRDREVRGDALVAAVQRLLNSFVKLHRPLKVDGFYGPATESACEVFIGSKVWRDDHKGVTAESPEQWPAYRNATEFFGAPGTNQTILELPYPMVLAWDESQTVNRFSINKLCEASARRVFQKTLDHYGYNQIVTLGLNQFGGCLNVRKMRGGSQLSTHSWGSAIDIDPANNRLRWGSDRASLAKSSYKAFWSFWEAEGWVSLGRKKNYDWMHVQAMT